MGFRRYPSFVSFSLSSTVTYHAFAPNRMDEGIADVFCILAEVIMCILWRGVPTKAHE